MAIKRLVDLASGALRSLTGGFDPALSPDGSQIVFTRDGGDAGVYLLNRTGSNQHPLPVNVPLTYTFVGERMLNWGR